jgi:hypothetical protein
LWLEDASPGNLERPTPIGMPGDVFPEARP